MESCIFSSAVATRYTRLPASRLAHRRNARSVELTLRFVKRGMQTDNFGVLGGSSGAFQGGRKGLLVWSRASFSKNEVSVGLAIELDVNLFIASLLKPVLKSCSLLVVRIV